MQRGWLATTCRHGRSKRFPSPEHPDHFDVKGLAHGVSGTEQLGLQPVSQNADSVWWPPHGPHQRAQPGLQRGQPVFRRHARHGVGVGDDLVRRLRARLPATMRDVWTDRTGTPRPDWRVCRQAMSRAVGSAGPTDRIVGAAGSPDASGTAIEGWSAGCGQTCRAIASSSSRCAIGLPSTPVHSGRRKGRLILRKNDRSDFQNCLISTDQIGEY